MTIEDILRAFSHKDSRFPREALEQAVALKDEITPGLLRILERLADVPYEVLDQDDFAHYYALYLLAQFRETRAYPLAVRIASLPPDIIDAALGDTITEGLPKILASVCGGDTSLITELAENTEVEMFARGAAVSALLNLVLSDDRSRDEVMCYYSRLYDVILQQKQSEERADVLSTITLCATILCPEELYERIKKAFEDELINEILIDLNEVKANIAEGRGAVLPRLREDPHYHLVESAIKEMEWWACYRESDDSSDAMVDLKVEEIMEAFSFDDGNFPREALRQAVAKKDQITPLLLEALERAVNDPEEILVSENISFIYAMFLLAQFRENRAYPLIIRLVSHSPKVVGDLIEDIPSEDLANILASVSLGATSLIEELVTNNEAEEFVRASAIMAWLSLVVSGDKSREEAIDYYKSLFEGGLADDKVVVWSELVCAATDLYPEEVYDQIKIAFAKGLVDEDIVEPDWVDDQIALGKEEVLSDLPDWSHLVDDVTIEMRSWFQNLQYGDEWDDIDDWYDDEDWEKDDWDRRNHSALNGNNQDSQSPFIAPKEIGGNEPCPCGSGKKFKRCCGA